MLVISQKKGEKLRIGRDITITILESKAGKVRLGIEAPQELEVMRESLYRERQQQGTQQGKALKAEAPAAIPESREPEHQESDHASGATSAADASSSSAQPA